MNIETIKRRARTIRRLLNEKKIGSLVVTKPANVTYTTGFMGGDSWAVITGRAVYLLTDSRYTEQAQGECRSCRIIERTSALPEATVKLLSRLKSGRSVAIEKSATLADFEALRKESGRALKTAANVVEDARSCKDAGEVSAVRAGGRIAVQALKQTRRYIKAGISESELAGRLDFQIRKLGAQNSFETIVAFGANGSRCHHQATKRTLRRDDYILIDFGARYKGYCCDLTRCFVVGNPSGLASYKKVYDAVQKAQAAAIKMVKAGVAIKQVDSAAREVIAKHDLPVYGHGTGHGLGIEIHENPFLNAENRGKLKAGQIITIEPGVYIPGKLGVRIEDDILVTQTGSTLLTGSCPHTFLRYR
jgi:Xaa-Pro aminopeptidase